MKNLIISIFVTFNIFESFIINYLSKYFPNDMKTFLLLALDLISSMILILNLSYPYNSAILILISL